MVPAPGETAGEWWSAVKHEQAIAPLLRRLGLMNTWGPEEMAEVFVHGVPVEIARAAERFNGIPGPGMFRKPWPLSAWPNVAFWRHAMTACSRSRFSDKGIAPTQSESPAPR